MKTTIQVSCSECDKKTPHDNKKYQNGDWSVCLKCKNTSTKMIGQF